jgi:hypothetical protein
MAIAVYEGKESASVIVCRGVGAGVMTNFFVNNAASFCFPVASQTSDETFY